MLDHVGLDKQKVATDERAKKVLGPELTKRVDQLAGKRLKIEQVRQEGGREVLVFRGGRGGTRHEVINPGLTDEEMEAVQDDVFQALGWA